MGVDDLVSHTLIPLNNGVSQQPAFERLDSQAEEQINMMSEETGEVRRRHPLEFIAGILSSSLDDLFFHFIARDESERFLVMIGDRFIKVFDLLDGSEKTVDLPDGVDYIDLSGSEIPSTSFVASSSGDTTFIVNRNIVTAMDSATVATRPNQVLIYQKIANSAGTHNVTFEARGVTPVDFTAVVVAGGADGTTDVIDDFKTAIDNLIAQAPPNMGSWATSGIFGIVSEGSMIFGLQDPAGDTNSDGIDRVEASDDFGNLHVFAWNDRVPNFSDLPARGPDGFVFEIVGDDATDFDNYWVVFQNFDADDLPLNKWVETVKPGIKFKFDPTTMPHTLVKLAAGHPSGKDFQFAEPVWDERLVGDEASAPEPSFIGQTIRHAFIHENRLQFVSGENTLGSESGRFFNYWPTTVTTVLDSDPVDSAGSTNQVAIWDWMVPFDGSLLLFSSGGRVQSRFGQRGTAIIPTTKPPTPVSRFAVDPKLQPITTGSSIFVAGGEDAAATHFRQLFTNEFDKLDARLITRSVPSYVPAGLSYLSASEDRNLFVSGVAGSGSTGREMFVFKHFISAGELAQSSWSKWTIAGLVGSAADTIIHAAEVIGTDLYVIYDFAGNQYALGKIDLSSTPSEGLIPIIEGVQDSDVVSGIFLDHFSKVTATYDAPTDTTTWTTVGTSPALGFVGGITHVRSTGILASAGGEFSGDIIKNVSSSVSSGDHIYTAAGDFSGTIFVGFRYESRWDPSEITMPTREAGTKRTHSDGDLQLTEGAVTVTDSGPFEVDVRYVTSPDEDPRQHPFNGLFLENPDLGGTTLYSTDHEFDLEGESKDVRVSIHTDGVLDLRIEAFRWVGRFFDDPTKV